MPVHAGKDGSGQSQPGSEIGLERFMRIVRYARQSTTRFYDGQFTLSFSIVYRLLSISADGQKGYSDETTSTGYHDTHYSAA